MWLAFLVGINAVCEISLVLFLSRRWDFILVPLGLWMCPHDLLWPMLNVKGSSMLLFSRSFKSQ